MAYRVILSHPALRDLGEIARYIARENMTAAERVGLDLVRLAESLAHMPRRGGKLRAKPDVLRLVSEPYLITYRIDDRQKIVYILRYWHAKRDQQNWKPD